VIKKNGLQPAWQPGFAHGYADGGCSELLAHVLCNGQAGQQALALLDDNFICRWMILAPATRL
jgi:hypothetical protein